jgi:rare lipoprotein A
VRLARPAAARALALAAALSIGAFASGGASLASAAPSVPAAPAGTIETGVASWYGADFHGRRTSNGEIYDKEKLSCAHRTLPFGSFVLVRNLDNDSSVVVRVNDRGPFAKNRIIDLSEAAARIIGMIPTGTARVSLTPIPREEALAWKGGGIDGAARAEGAMPAGEGTRNSPPAKEPSPVASLPPDARVRIQVASYGNEANAKATVDRLAASGLSASIERSGGHYRVVFPDLSPEAARTTVARLEGLGYRGYSMTTRTPADRQ